MVRAMYPVVNERCVRISYVRGAKSGTPRAVLNLYFSSITDVAYEG